MSTQPKRFARIEIVEADVPGTRLDPKSLRPHFLRLVASNGQTLATSETYANKTNARRAVQGWVAAFLQVGFAEANGRPPVVEVAK